MREKLETNENLDFIPFNIALEKLGQVQYSSRFVNPHPKLHEDGTPFFSEIRIEGNPDNYHSLKIHKDDIRIFIEKWFEYKKQSSPFFGNKNLEDYLPNN